MKPDLDPQLQAEAEHFDLLEHPERWPEDPVLQAELAQMLELHLALQAHGPRFLSEIPPPRPRVQVSSWLMVAAATLLAVVPSIYALQHMRLLTHQAQNRAYVEETARRRAEVRLWTTFFEQTRDLLKRFDRQPPLCDPTREDRNEERLTALALLQASHQLAAQGGAPLAQAESARNELHVWLTEFSLEDGCLSPTRVDELRRLAHAQDLESQAQKLEALLKDGTP